MDLGDWNRQHEEQVQGIDALWEEFGCGKAPPRTNAHIQATLAALAKRHSMPVIIAMWRYASTVAHAFGPDVAFCTGTGPSQRIWLAPPLRAYFLVNLVMVYSKLTLAAASVLGGAPPSDFVEYTVQLQLATDGLLAAAVKSSEQA